MTTGERIYNCRKKAGMTQEELADKLGVSRQAVSKWEADAAYPETETILELCKLFSLSADELLFGGNPPHKTEETEETDSFIDPPAEEAAAPQQPVWGRIPHEGLHYEYVSKARLWGLPVLHVNIGLGVYRAKGIFALGNIATGFFTLGLLSVGLIAFGFLSLGILAFGDIALGLLSAAGVAIGLITFGGVSIGAFMSFGGLAIGQFAVGGAAFGRIAIGGYAEGWLAVGAEPYGEHVFYVPEDMEALSDFLTENVSPFLGRIVRSITRDW